MNHDMSYVVTDRVLLVPEIRFRFFRNQPKKVVFGKVGKGEVFGLLSCIMRQ